MFAAIAVLALVAHASSSEDVAALVAEAVRARESGDLARTLELLERAKSIAPHFKIEHNIGAVLQDLGRYREAAEAYHRVLDDPAATADVKALDRERLAMLEPKLDRAWVIAHDHEVWVDDQKIAANTEVAFDPERHHLEIAAEDRIRVLEIALEPGLRTNVDVIQSEESCTALLEPAGKHIAVGDHVLHSARPGAQIELTLPCGPHAIAVDDYIVDVVLERGRPIRLARPAPATPETLVEQTEVRDRSWKPGAGPAALALVGVTAVTFATAFGLSAAHDRGQIEDATTENGVITGLTMRQAAMLEATADRKTGSSSVLFVVGGSALAGAVVWWLIDSL
jgi:hypothetical protein